MGLTAFLAPSLLSGLSDVSVSPESAQNGYPLVWNNTLGKWVASTLQIASLAGGPLPLTLGGTNSSTGSIQATGNLSFGTDSPNKVLISPFLQTTVASSPGSQTGIEAFLASSQNNSRQGVFLNKQVIEETGVTAGVSFAALYNGTTRENAFIPVFAAKAYGAIETSSINFIGFQHPLQTDSIPVISFDFRRGLPTGSSVLNDSGIGVSFTNRTANRWSIRGNGNVAQVGTLAISNTTESSSTTTGSFTTLGGVGIAKNLYCAGTKVNFANLPTADTGLAVGDLWRDGNLVKIKL